MTGLGRKELNFYSIAMCDRIHGEWTRNDGRFAGFTKLMRFAWFMAKIGEAHQFFVILHGCSPNVYEPTEAEGALIKDWWR